MKLNSALIAGLLATVIPSQAQQATYKAADAELNRLYQKIESRLSGDAAAKHKLVAAQRAWVAFRDAECTFAASGVEGGSAYPQVLEACLQDLTETRVENFNAYLNCEEGDLSCPVPAN